MPFVINVYVELLVFTGMTVFRETEARTVTYIVHERQGRLKGWTSLGTQSILKPSLSFGGH